MTDAIAATGCAASTGRAGYGAAGPVGPDAAGAAEPGPGGPAEPGDALGSSSSDIPSSSVGAGDVGRSAGDVGRSAGAGGAGGPAGVGGATRRDAGTDRRRFEIARDWIIAGGSVLIYGRPGTGKSALLDSVATAAAPVRLLRATATAEDTDRPFLTLAWLLSSLTDAELRRLPATQRRVLASVLVRDTAADPDATPATIRHAVLELLRTLTLDGPVLIAVDDLHHMDHATAGLLRFVADRVDGLPIWLLAAERVPVDCPPVGRPLCPAPLLVISV
jgi:hypothetical protein